MKRNHIRVLILCIVLLLWVLFSDKCMEVMQLLLTPKTDKIVVVIDAGHGGFDPGKVGINKALEKDINLSIAYKLKSLLEQNDIEVIMTRTNDKGLYRKSDHNKKMVDMKNRIMTINRSNAIIAISIHQNSFSQQSSRGAQVFYYKTSEEGKMLAEIIQKSLKDTLKDGNRRLAKGNDKYYLLKNSRYPLVIVECGFLSNWEEANLLCEENYQEKLAWAIHLGIMEYINKKYNEDIDSAKN